MKKRAAALALALVLALSCAPVASADAGEFVSYPEGTVIDLSDEGLERGAKLSVAFEFVAPGSYFVSDEGYYTETGEITLDILGTAWSPADCPLWIGFINLDEGRDFGYKFKGGIAHYWKLVEARNMEAGTYHIFVKNLGRAPVSGAMVYRVGD